MYEKVNNAIKNAGMSRLRCAIEMGICPSDLYAALNGKKPMYPAYKRKLAEVLQISEAELFDEEGMKNE